MKFKNIQSYDEFKLRNQPQELKVTVPTATAGLVAVKRAKLYPSRIVVDVASFGKSFQVSGFTHRFRILNATWAPTRTAHNKYVTIHKGVSSGSDQVVQLASNTASGAVAAVVAVAPSKNVISPNNTLTFKKASKTSGGRIVLDIEPWEN